MSIGFINDHGISGTDIQQDGNYIGYIRYSRLDGYIITCDEDAVFDIEELEQILSKMKALQNEVKNV